MPVPPRPLPPRGFPGAANHSLDVGSTAGPPAARAGKAEMSGGAEDSVQGELEEERAAGRGLRHLPSAGRRCRRVPPRTGRAGALHMERDEDWGWPGVLAGWRGPAQGAGAAPTSLTPPGSTHCPEDPQSRLSLI